MVHTLGIIAIKLVIAFGCGALDAWGGKSFLAARRYIMPFVLAVALCVFTFLAGLPWWIGFFVAPACGTFTLPYFSGANWGRALWLFVQAIALGGALTVIHFIPAHVSWHWIQPLAHVGLNPYVYLGYIIGAGIFGGIYKNWQQVKGDEITGMYLCGIPLLFINLWV